MYKNSLPIRFGHFSLAPHFSLLHRIPNELAAFTVHSSLALFSSNLRSSTTSVFVSVTNRLFVCHLHLLQSAAIFTSSDIGVWEIIEQDLSRYNIGS